MNHCDDLAFEPLASIDSRVLFRALRDTGVWLDVGGLTLHVRSDAESLAVQLRQAYAEFPFTTKGDWADIHVQINRASDLRRWVRPQVGLLSDGRRLFDAFPADSPLPLFEWGCNWLIGQRMNDLLLLHAGAVERDGLALVMPATPGSGKSTLTAALSHRGWRLLSDEFGAFDPRLGAFRAMLKPVALKNHSIDVIRRLLPEAHFGPEFPRTRKGRVVHLAAQAAAVARRHVPARPGAFLLPKWQEGSPTRLEPLQENHLFPALAFNAFNYGVLGEVSFKSIIELVRLCPGWQLVYSDLSEALGAIDDLWPQVRRRHAALMA